MLTFKYQNAWIANYSGTAKEIAWLKKVFTYQDMTDIGHKNRFGYFPSVLCLDSVMSHGQVIHAIKEAKAANVPFTVEDPNFRYMLETGPIPKDYLPDGIGRDYQLLTSQIALGKGHGIIRIGTGGGKTYCAGIIVKYIVTQTDCPGILFLIFSKDLLNQTAKRFESYGVPPEDIGIIHSDISQKEQQIASTKRVILSTHLSITKFQGVIEKTRYVLCDECFPSGTLVGSKKIEDIKIGDFVPSFDEKTSTITMDKVVSTMKRKPNTMISIETIVGNISCTEEHPFWTPNGWVIASFLKKGMFIAYENKMRYMRRRNRKISKMEWSETKLRKMQSKKSTRAKGRTYNKVFLLRMQLPNLIGHTRKKKSSKKARRNPLQSKMYYGKTQKNLWCSLNSIHQRKSSKKHEGNRPYSMGKDENRNDENTKKNWTPTKDKRRERSSTTNSTTKIIRCFGGRMGNGISNKNEGYTKPERIETSNLLQIRHCKSKFDDCHRSKRFKPYFFKSTRKRQEKRKDFSWVRVENTSFHKPGSDGTFGGICSDGFVYNIETEKYHTYIANNFVVHNCHKTIGPMWSSLFPMLPNLSNILGFTATPWDSEGERQKMLAVFGQMLVDIPAKWLIQQNILIKPEIYFIRLHYKDRNIKVLNAMDWRQAEKQLILEEKNRNLLPIVVLKKFGGRMLVIYDKLDHGETLLNLYKENGYETRLAEGKTSTKDRESAISWFEKDLEPGQQGKVLLASRVFDEGVDIKGGCDLGFLVGAGKDPSRQKQRLGRLLRQNKTGKVKVFDVQDSNHKILSRWSGIRREAILEETGIDPEIISLEDFMKL